MKETKLDKLVLTTKKISLLDSEETREIKGGATPESCFDKSDGPWCCSEIIVF